METSNLNVRMAEPSEAMLAMDKMFLNILNPLLVEMAEEGLLPKGQKELLPANQINSIKARIESGCSNKDPFVPIVKNLCARYLIALNSYKACLQESYPAFKKSCSNLRLKSGSLAAEQILSDPFFEKIRIMVKEENDMKRVHPKVLEFKNLVLSEKEASKIVFVDKLATAHYFKNGLSENGFSAEVVHGGRKPDMLEKIFSCFKQGEINTLISLSRTKQTFQIPAGVDMVINYSIPSKKIVREERQNLVRQGEGRLYYICLNHRLDRIRLFGPDNWQQEFQQALF